MAILLEILFGKSGEIYNYLYEKGLINETFSKEYTAEQDYAYSAFGGESKDPIAVREEILRRLKNFRIRQQDFARAKNVTEGGILRLFNSIERTGNNFISHAFNNINILDYANVCENISIVDIMSRFERHFKPQNMAISIVTPHQK
jgi:predicted Zn-dependent peptidase